MSKRWCVSPHFSSDSGFEYNPEASTFDLVPAHEEVIVTTSALKKLSKSWVAKKQAEPPLPDPFPLSKNYRPDVYVALKSGEMTEETKTSFISKVASAIHNYRKYPTKEEFTRVATDIITRYPFLASPSSCGTKTVLELYHTML